MATKNDGLDNLVLFLAKRDGIDKLVKTFQYVFKLAHWRLQEKHPDLAARANLFSAQCGLSRKCFRTGRFLTGFNALRHTRQPNWIMTILTLFGNSGDMVYFFFDHLTWMSRVGLLNPHLAARLCHVSASGEAVAYVAFVTLELISIRAGQKEEKKLQEKLKHCLQQLEEADVRFGSSKRLLLSSNSQIESLNTDVSVLGNDSTSQTTSISASSSNSVNSEESGSKSLALSDSQRREEVEKINEEVKQLEEQVRTIRAQRFFQLMGIAANVADLLIAIAEIEPNPICTHPITLGLSGLVSAWAGWFRNWPS